MAKLKWTDGRYGTATIDLGVAHAEVAWGSSRGDKYIARLSYGPYKTGFESVDDAKEWAEGKLRSGLRAALTKLDGDQ